jgi:hypothetical protein
MMFAVLIALKLFGWGRNAFAWLAKKPERLIILALIIACAFFWIRGNQVAKQRDKAVAGLKIAQQTIENVKAAQNLAERVMRDNLARVTAKQKEISDHAEKTYTADARAWADRFAQLRAKANRGASGHAVLSTGSAAPGQPENPDHHSPADYTLVRIDELELVVEGAVRGKAIQDWALENERVETSPQ